MLRLDCRSVNSAYTLSACINVYLYTMFCIALVLLFSQRWELVMSLGSVAVSAHEAAVACTPNTSSNTGATNNSSYSASALAKQLPQPVYRYLPGRNNAARAAGKRDIHMFQKR
jgi:hypothetical protein